jgi:hypothetical protein
MIVAIYNVSDGKITRRTECPVFAVDAQLGEDEDFYLNCPDTATHIVNSEAVTIQPPEPSLEALKVLKRKDISEDFEWRMRTGRVASTLGFTVDARRSDTKNDLQNMGELAAYMEQNGVSETSVVDADDREHQGLTHEQVAQLAAEIRDYGFYLFATKRGRIAALEAASSPAEVVSA